MSTLERFGVTGDVAVLRPADHGVHCKESDVIDIATELARNRTVTSVDLSHACVSPEAAKALGTALGKNTQAAVQHLALTHCDMHADAVAALAPLLAGNERLEVLDLGHNPLRDEGAASVAELIGSSQALRTVDLAACKIGPSGARALGRALAPNTKLRSLSLTNNKLRAAGITAMSDGLQRNTALRVLDVSGNSINAEGGLAIAEMLRANGAIEHLNVARNYLSDAIPRIGHALSTRACQMRLLDLSSNRIDGPICRQLAQVLEGNRISVACLSLEDNDIGDAGMVPLYHAVKGTNTQFLDLSSTGLTLKSGVVVADLMTSCPILNSLQLDGNQLGEDAGVEIASGYGQSQGLTAINLERCNIGSRTVAALCDAFTQHRGTRNVNLSENPGIKPADVLRLLLVLGQQSSLEELDLSSLDLPESEEILRALVDLFAANRKLSAVLLEHTSMGGSIPQSIMTRDVAAALVRASGGNVSAIVATGHNNTTTLGGGNGTLMTGSAIAGVSTINASGQLVAAGGNNSSVGMSKVALTRNAETIFKPAWALSVPLDAPTHDADEAEDGAHPPLVPHPASLHDPRYPGYGKGRFSNGCLVQSLSNPLPYNVAMSLGSRRAFIPSADGASLLANPPRKHMKESPYSLHALENNPGQLPVTEDQLRRKFSELDVDGNGYLDRDEFKALYISFQSFGLPMSSQEADEMFAKYAGADRKLQFDEFCIMMLKLASR